MRLSRSLPVQSDPESEFTDATALTVLAHPADEPGIKPAGVDVVEGVVADVGVAVEHLRVSGRYDEGVRRQEASQRSAVEAGTTLPRLYGSKSFSTQRMFTSGGWMSTLPFTSSIVKRSVLPSLSAPSGPVFRYSYWMGN